MCGIVGYIGKRPAAEVMLPALKRLEYRGYDSAGIAMLNGGGFEVLRSVGKLAALERLVASNGISGDLGIGHTRWATHGRVSEENAHPHIAGRVAVIHNGIVENFLELRCELAARGRRLRSETDTEVIAHLIDEGLGADLDLAAAVRSALQQLQGSFAIVVMDQHDRMHLFAAKSATPIVIGLGDGENFIASDVPALLDYTRKIVYLEDGEIAEVTRDGVSITDFDGRPRSRAPRMIEWDAETARKGGYRHFLLKEIHEQPDAVADTLRDHIDAARGRVRVRDVGAIAGHLEDVQRLSLVACGTAWHACLVGRYFLNALAGLRADADYGSEFRYRGFALDRHDLVIAVSQSGETADTLGSVEEARRSEAATLAVCNVVDSSIARRADAVIYTKAGPEVSVCSTKAFTTQLTALLLLSLELGRRRGRGASDLFCRVEASLRDLPRQIETVLAVEDAIAAIAREIADARNCLFLGRGINYPIALEGALKLKEISYIHAEGYPAGEMKHGPIALITDEMPVIVLLPKDASYPKTLSNMKEVESRGGRIIAVTDAPTDDIRRVASHVIEVPHTHPLLTPFVNTIPLQLLAYHVAVARGTDVDQPRNLAKSVTVE
jgi:glutamine---fructose-6-phosphate transaminase (isomerizing)